MNTKVEKELKEMGEGRRDKVVYYPTDISWETHYHFILLNPHFTLMDNSINEPFSIIIMMNEDQRKKNEEWQKILRDYEEKVKSKKITFEEEQKFQDYVKSQMENEWNASIKIEHDMLEFLNFKRQ